MSYLVTIDPGLRACGCALWEGSELLAAAHVSSVARGEELSAQLIGNMATAVRGWVRGHLGWDLDFVDYRVVVELPQTYGGRAAKGDTNDLITLAAVCGALIVELGTPTALVKPHDWKGTIPKKNSEGVNVIMERCLEELSRVELARVVLPTAKSLQHNVWDAVGIGLWYLKKSGLRK